MPCLEVDHRIMSSRQWLPIDASCFNNCYPIDARWIETRKIVENCGPANVQPNACSSPRQSDRSKVARCKRQQQDGTTHPFDQVGAVLAQVGQIGPRLDRTEPLERRTRSQGLPVMSDRSMPIAGVEDRKNGPLPRQIEHCEPSRTVTSLFCQSPFHASPTRGFQHRHLDLVERNSHGAKGHRSQSASGSSGKGLPWNKVMRTHRSDRGSKRAAPKKASLHRRMSIGRIDASIRLSRISE